jgi:hypothetical protein
VATAKIACSLVRLVRQRNIEKSEKGAEIIILSYYTRAKLVLKVVANCFRALHYIIERNKGAHSGGKCVSERIIYILASELIFLITPFFYTIG